MNIQVVVLSALMLTMLSAMTPAAVMESGSARVALVIGNARYPDSEAPLKEPINDVRDIADELKHDGLPAAPPDVASSSPAATPVRIQDNGKTALVLADVLNNKIAANPNDANALYRRGQVYAGKGAYALAIKDFDATIRLNPKDVEAHNNRCWTRTVIGELQSARRDCDEALRLRPDFVDALDSRGLLNLKSGANKDAIVDFDAALRINPRLTSSLHRRGLTRQRTGAATEGNLDIANAKAMDPDIVKEFAGYGVR